jgi:hypothetical protein
MDEFTEIFSLGSVPILRASQPVSGLEGEGRVRRLHETCAAAPLNHPFIVAIYETSEQGHIPYIGMDFGLTLLLGQENSERRAPGPGL